MPILKSFSRNCPNLSSSQHYVLCKLLCQLQISRTHTYIHQPSENSFQSKPYGDDQTHPAVAKSLYILPTDEQERRRLDYSLTWMTTTDKSEHNRLEVQHEVLRNAFGGRIVFAPIELHAGDKVLDNGAGSGLWSSEILFLDLTVGPLIHQQPGFLTAITPIRLLPSVESIW